MDFLEKNIEEIKWNKLLNSFYKIQANISIKMIPIFKTFERKIKEKSFETLYNELKNKEINLEKFNKLSYDKKIKYIIKFVWKGIENIEKIKFNVEFWNSFKNFKDYKKDISSLIDKNQKITNFEWEIMVMKSSMYFIDRISLFQLLKSNLTYNWDFSFKLKSVRNIMIHNSLLIALSEENKILLRDFFQNDYKNILNRLEISTQWDLFIKQINNLEEEILITPKNKEEDLKVKNTNYLLKIILKEFKKIFI